MNARALGLKVIGVTSVAYAHGTRSRHSSGGFLRDHCDIVLDSKIAIGDAELTAAGIEAPFAPASTVVTSAVMQAMMAAAAEHLVARGVEPPMLRSGNVDGGHEWNGRVMTEYRDRIFYRHGGDGRSGRRAAITGRPHGQASPSGSDLPSPDSESSGQTLQSTTGQVDRRRVDKHAKLLVAASDLVKNPSTRSFVVPQIPSIAGVPSPVSPDGCSGGFGRRPAWLASTAPRSSCRGVPGQPA